MGRRHLIQSVEEGGLRVGTRDSQENETFWPSGAVESLLATAPITIIDMFTTARLKWYLHIDRLWYYYCFIVSESVFILYQSGQVRYR